MYVIHLVLALKKVSTMCVFGRVLTVRFATSLISESQAMTNLLAEVSAEKKSFDTLVEDSRLEWRKTLSRVLICNEQYY